MIINIGLIDDSYFALSLYKEFFQNFKDVSVVFAVSSVSEIEKGKVFSNIQPDIVFLDIMLNEENGIECVPAIKKLYPNTKVVMLTASESENDLIKSIRIGASGYVVKDNNLFELYTALKKIVADGAFMCSKAADLVVGTIQKRHTLELDELLTKREREMMEFIKQGLSYKDIAQNLFITTFTVNHHMKKIFKKLNVSSKSELVSKLWSKEF